MKFTRPTLALLSLALTLPLFSQGSGTGADKQKEQPSQASVASKTAKFPTITESSSEVKSALQSKDLDKAMKLVGKKGSFVGVVDHTFSPKHNRTVYINFSKSFKETISGNVNFEDYKKFPSLSELKGKKVLITGTFRAYQDTHPEIVVKDLDQIKIIQTSKK